MVIGSFQGTRLTVHWLFAVLLLGAAALGYAVEALILLGALLTHELAHWAAAWALDIGVAEIELTPVGGMARLDAALEADPQAETVVALAGPFNSGCLAALGLALSGVPAFDAGLVRFFTEVNLSLAAFNLLPALPLDGGRAVRGILARRLGHARVTRAMVGLGRLLAALLLGLAAAALTVGWVLPTPAVAGAFLWLTAGREAAAGPYRALAGLVQKRRQLRHRRVVPAQALVAPADATLGEVLRHLVARRYHLITVVDDGLRPLGVLAEAALLTALQERGPGASLGEIVAHHKG